MTLGAQWAIAWMRRAAVLVADHSTRLVELDRRIGDGDHGENLARGFRAVLARLEARSAPPSSVGEVLDAAATTLMTTVGGASGPLYGTGFLRAAQATGIERLDSAAVVAMLEGALDGVVSRGGAGVGEKTMVDAWHPAVEAAVAAADGGAEPFEVLAAAAAGAEAGVASTVPMAATKGRASYFGELSVGHADPGAASTAIVLLAAAQTADEASSRAA